MSARIPGFHLECACGVSPIYVFAAARVQPATINNHVSSVSRFWQMLHFVCAQEHNAFIGNIIPFHCRILVRMQPWSQQKYKLFPAGSFVLELYLHDLSAFESSVTSTISMSAFR